MHVYSGMIDRCFGFVYTISRTPSTLRRMGERKTAQSPLWLAVCVCLHFHLNSIIVAAVFVCLLLVFFFTSVMSNFLQTDNLAPTFSVLKIKPITNNDFCNVQLLLCFCFSFRHHVIKIYYLVGLCCIRFRLPLLCRLRFRVKFIRSTFHYSCSY